MCEANAYLYEKDHEELIMDSVDKVTMKDGEIYLEDIFGQRKILNARIKELQLVDHKIILERVSRIETQERA
jgi:predicted RNA-binding protein